MIHTLTRHTLTYHYSDQVAADDALRASFNALSQQTFGLNFEPWHQQGYWQNGYHPHVLLHQNQVVANVSISLIPTEYQGVAKTYGQIGTVMTHPDHRHRGLADALMQQVIKQWLPQCDALYLYANGSVLDFYPRYGFVPAQAHQHQRCLNPRSSPKQALNMGSASDVRLLRQRFEQGNPFAELPLRGNWGLLMFYCSQFLNECVHYLPELDAVVIVEEEDAYTLLYDVYGAGQTSLNDVMAALAHSSERPVVLGFTPKNGQGFDVSVIAEAVEDEYLFVHAQKDNPFVLQPLTMPALSKA